MVSKLPNRCYNSYRNVSSKIFHFFEKFVWWFIIINRQLQKTEQADRQSSRTKVKPAANNYTSGSYQFLFCIRSCLLMNKQHRSALKLPTYKKTARQFKLFVFTFFIASWLKIKDNLQNSKTNMLALWFKLNEQ